MDAIEEREKDRGVETVQEVSLDSTIEQYNETVQNKHNAVEGEVVPKESKTED